MRRGFTEFFDNPDRREYILRTALAQRTFAPNLSETSSIIDNRLSVEIVFSPSFNRTTGVQTFFTGTSISLSSGVDASSTNKISRGPYCCHTASAIPRYGFHAVRSTVSNDEFNGAYLTRMFGFKSLFKSGLAPRPFVVSVCLLNDPRARDRVRRRFAKRPTNKRARRGRVIVTSCPYGGQHRPSGPFFASQKVKEAFAPTDHWVPDIAHSLKSNKLECMMKVREKIVHNNNNSRSIFGVSKPRLNIKLDEATQTDNRPSGTVMLETLFRRGSLGNTINRPGRSATFALQKGGKETVDFRSRKATAESRETRYNTSRNKGQPFREHSRLCVIRRSFSYLIAIG